VEGPTVALPLVWSTLLGAQAVQAAARSTFLVMHQFLGAMQVLEVSFFMQEAGAALSAMAFSALNWLTPWDRKDDHS